MENITKKPKYLTIAQARTEYINYSAEWYMRKLRSREINGTGGGFGSKWQIERASLERYLNNEDETLWPMR